MIIAAATILQRFRCLKSHNICFRGICFQIQETTLCEQILPSQAEPARWL